jgi:tetratricopeptide (TPR) repeat protein
MQPAFASEHHIVYLMKGCLVHQVPIGASFPAMKKLLVLWIIFAGNAAVAQTAQDYFEKAKHAFATEAYKDVLGWVDAAIELDPDQAEFYYFKANFLALAGLKQESLNVYNMALSRLPNEAILNLGRGDLLYQLEQYSGAIRDYGIAMDLAKHDSIRYTALGQRGATKLTIRDFDGAYADLQQCLVYDSVDLVALNSMATTCTESGKFEEAKKYFLKIIKIYPNNFIGYLNLGYFYQFVQEHELAIETLNKALEISPKQAYAFSNRSYNKLKLGDIRGAKKDIATSIKLDPDNSYAYKNRALIYLESGEPDKACEDLQTALQKGFTALYGQEVDELYQKYCR